MSISRRSRAESAGEQETLDEDEIEALIGPSINRPAAHNGQPLAAATPVAPAAT